jgi:hypothetical protein
MTRSNIVNWRASKTQKCLLSLENPITPPGGEPVIKIYAYELKAAEMAEFQRAVNDAASELARLQPPVNPVEVLP